MEPASARGAGSTAAPSVVLCRVASLRMRPLRWMFPYGTEGTAQVDERRTIKVQGGHGGPSGGRASLDEQEIRAPGEMARPALAAWVEQANGSPRLWIARMGLCLFVAVARGARPGQFRSRAARTADARHDVFADERGTRESGEMLTVFATIAGAVAHLPPHRPRNGFTRHPCGLRGRAPLSRLVGIGPGDGIISPGHRPVRHRGAAPPGPEPGSRPVPSGSTGRARCGR